MVTKLAPPRLQSLMMGLWFFTFSLANLLGGLVARFSKRLEAGEVTFVLEGLPGFYLMLVVFPMAAGVLILLLTPLLKRMMHGVK
jgi:POT family proton-dependent oligopeptide transporter